MEGNIMRTLRPEDIERLNRPLTGPEKKYGRNEWQGEPVLCPRCCCAEPIKVEPDFKNFVVRLLCRKCLTLGHVAGALIKEIPMEPHSDTRVIDG